MGGTKVRLQLRDPGGFSCKSARKAVSRVKSKKKKSSQKEENPTLGGLQLTSQAGPLNLGLVVAGHDLVVQDGASLRNRLREAKSDV
jgi:hypothetical protein